MELSKTHKENVQKIIKEKQAEKTAVELTNAQYEVAGIIVDKIEQITLSNVLRANGVMDVPPQNVVSISAPLGGFVASTELLQGMKVKKGQLLVILEQPDYIQLQQDFIDEKNKCCS